MLGRIPLDHAQRLARILAGNGHGSDETLRLTARKQHIGRIAVGLSEHIVNIDLGVSENGKTQDRIVADDLGEC